MGVLDQIELCLELRVALTLDLLILHKLVDYVGALVQQVDQAVEFLTAHVHPATLGNAPNLAPTASITGARKLAAF